MLDRSVLRLFQFLPIDLEFVWQSLNVLDITWSLRFAGCSCLDRLSCLQLQAALGVGDVNIAMVEAVYDNRSWLERTASVSAKVL